MAVQTDPGRPLLITVLRSPEKAASLDDAAWGQLIRQARNANVLGRMLSAVETQVPCADWPQRVQQIYRAEKNISDHRHASLLWEVGELSRALSPADIRPVLLKGAAYALERKPFARFRNFGDIDLLVPRDRLPTAEQLLIANGWLTTKTDAYDQQYYRRWMHELPPMRHIHRGTNLDVHHAILPLTARYQPDSSRLLAAVQGSLAQPAVDVLCAEDMFLHGAAHLFCEGEHENALRNLLDLHDLLAEFPDHATAVPALVNRAIELDLTVVLALAGRYIHRIFGLPCANDVTGTMRDKGVLPNHVAWHDWMFGAVFLGFHPSCRQANQGLARQALYLRSHFLRMPLPLLAKHLLHKAWLNAKKD